MKFRKKINETVLHKLLKLTQLVGEHGTVVIEKKVKLDTSVLVFASAENVLLSLLKNMGLINLRSVKKVKYLKVILRTVKINISPLSSVDVKFI